MDSEPRVVSGASRRLAISNGDWVLVKDRLNAGENRRMVHRGTTTTAEGQLQTDLIEAGLAKILAFLLDWSLKIPIRGPGALPLDAALDSIDPDSYTEILRAIEAHETAMQAERDAQKKIQPGDSPSSTPSLSPVPAASPTSGSSN